MKPELIVALVIAVISPLTTLAIVFIAPHYSFRAARDAMLGPMRQAWINTLRDNISEFISVIYAAHFQIGAGVTGTDEVRAQIEKDRIETTRKAVQLKEKVALLINPEEADHKELIRLVELVFDKYSDGSDTSATLLNIRKQSQVVLKREWEVVKQPNKADWWVTKRR